MHASADRMTGVVQVVDGPQQAHLRESEMCWFDQMGLWVQGHHIR